jgi:hypothetical protein
VCCAALCAVLSLCCADCTDSLARSPFPVCVHVMCCVCRTFRGEDRKVLQKLNKINRPAPVKLAEPKGLVHRFTYEWLVANGFMFPVAKDPKRNSACPRCWFNCLNCGFCYGNYAKFCANLVFEFITSPKMKLDQVKMQAVYIGSTLTSSGEDGQMAPVNGDLLFEDVLSIAVLNAEVSRKPDVTYVIRYNFFGTKQNESPPHLFPSFLMTGSDRLAV